MVSINMNQYVNNQSCTLGVNTNVECAIRFAILADTAEEDLSLQGNINYLIATDVDLEASQGVSPVKNTPVVRNPRVSTHSVDKYNLELRLKPKHRNAVSLAKDNATFKRWNGQTTTKYGFIPLGIFFPQIKMLGTPVQVTCLILITTLNPQATSILWMPRFQCLFSQGWTGGTHTLRAIGMTNLNQIWVSH